MQKATDINIKKCLCESLFSQDVHAALVPWLLILPPSHPSHLPPFSLTFTNSLTGTKIGERTGAL